MISNSERSENCHNSGYHISKSLLAIPAAFTFLLGVKLVSVLNNWCQFELGQIL